MPVMPEHGCGMLKCGICGKQFVSFSGSTPEMVEAAKKFVHDVIGGDPGPLCPACWSSFLQWYEDEGKYE